MLDFAFQDAFFVDYELADMLEGRGVGVQGDGREAFLVVDGSREVGRITGYADDSMFWGLLGDLLRRNTVSATDPAAGVTR